MMQRTRYKRIAASGLLAIVFIHVSLLSFVAAPSEAHAMPVEESGPALISIKTTAVSTANAAVTAKIIAGFTSISATADSVHSSAYVAKEMPFGLDTIVWFLVNTLIEEMIRSTTQWVNSGFQGSPAFITDLEAFTGQIADNVAGAFIEQVGLGFFCSPFRLNVAAALRAQYDSTYGRNFQCRLSDVISNVEGFLAGDFFAGGWDGWLELTAYPQNNPYGAMYLAQTGLAVSIQNAQGRELRLLDWGKGFMAVELCEDVSSPPSPEGFIITRNVCSDVTPGTFVEHRINSKFDIPEGRLTIADEVDELLGSLLIQLAQQALGGGGGLRGLTDSQYGQGDYFDRIEYEMNNSGVPGEVARRGLDDMKRVIDDEAEYRTVTRSILNKLNDAANYKRTTYGTTTRCASSSLTDSLQAKRELAQQNASSSNAVIQELQDLRADLRIVQSASSTSASTLTALWRKYNASSTVQAQVNIMREFNDIRTSGVLHSPSETERIRVQVIPELNTEIKEFTDTIDTACRTSGNRPIIIGTTTTPGT